MESPYSGGEGCSQTREWDAAPKCSLTCRTCSNDWYCLRCGGRSETRGARQPVCGAGKAGAAAPGERALQQGGPDTPIFTDWIRHKPRHARGLLSLPKTEIKSQARANPSVRIRWDTRRHVQPGFGGPWWKRSAPVGRLSQEPLGSFAPETNCLPKRRQAS